MELLPTLVQTELPGPDGGISLGELFGNDQKFLLQWAESIAQLDSEAVNVFFQVPVPEAFDGDAMLRNTSCPIMLLQANPAFGGILPDKDIGRCLSIRPQTVVRRFDRLGHMMHMQDSEQVLPVVREFLESLE